MIVYATPEDKGKRKAVQEPRNSSRLQQKYATSTSFLRGTTSTRSALGTNSLLDNFFLLILVMLKLLGYLRT
jgi:hypothetical protein